MSGKIKENPDHRYRIDSLLSKGGLGNIILLVGGQIDLKQDFAAALKSKRRCFHKHLRQVLQILVCEKIAEKIQQIWKQI